MRFSGYGKGQPGGWKKRRYCKDGTVIDDDGKAPPKKRKGPAVHHRFKPFISYQLHKKDAEECGAHRDAGGATHFTSEAQLNRHLAMEKAHGRVATWREH